MKVTIELDHDLLAKAQALSGLKQRSGLIQEALTALIERESARRLAHLGGSESGIPAWKIASSASARNLAFLDSQIIAQVSSNTPFGAE
jgi:metal-responsive CopG/Arc/MetJ family transcriptional regulator